MFSRERNPGEHKHIRYPMMSSKAKGMSNNSKKGKNARPSKEVKIMLKLNCSGRRIALTNPVDASSATLEDVLQLVAEQETDTPISAVLKSSGYEDSNLIFIRTSVPKSQWHSTTLNQIGIENGVNALLTLNIVLTSTNKSESSTIDTNVTTTISSTTNNESALTIPGIPAHASSSLVHADPERKVPHNSSSKKKEVVDVEEVESVEPETAYTPRTAVEQILSSNFDVDCKECCTALLRIVNNIISKPKEAKYRKINIQNTAFNQKVATKRGGLEFLHAIGFLPLHEFGVQYLVLDPQNEVLHTILEAQDALLTAAAELGVSTAELPRVKPPSIPVVESVRPMKFDVYRGQMFNTAAAAAGAVPTTIAPDGDVYVSKIDRELKSLIAKTKILESEMTSKELDRGIMAYLPVYTVNEDNSMVVLEQGPSGKGDGALLSSRAKRILEESQKRENGGFTTKAMRDLDKVKQTKIYAFTKLRICFPDGYSVSAKFYPSETVAAVRRVLVNEVLTVNCDFDFYVTPPRRALADHKTLTEEQLVPAAKIHISWKISPTSSNYIKPELFGSKTDTEEDFPESKGVLDVSKPKSELKPERNEDDMVKRMLGKGGTGTLKLSSNQGEQSSDKQGPKKYPSWFKR